MSFNGSGTFLINSTGQPVVANTVISATVFNALTADLASGLTNCITKDGQSTPTANIPMGSNKITGLANGTLASDAANLGQVQTTAAKLITSVSGADTVTGIMSPTLTAYAAGQLFYFVAAGANTGAVTLNIDGLGAKAVTRDGASALAAGDIHSGEMVVVIYDGTRFQMINAANSFGNTTINGTLTVTGNTALQANVSITSALSVHGTFNVSGAAALGSTLAVTGKSDLPTVSTASVNAAVAAITTATVTNLTATSASVASVNAGVALLTTATVTDLTASSASIASANIGNLQFTAASIASINAGVAVVTNLTATSASIASANVGTAVVTTGTVTNLTSTSASIASANAAVALVTTGTVTNLTSTAASIASANLGNAVVTTLTATGASVASANAGVANVSDLRVVGASVTSANVGTALVTRLDVTGASAASINAGVALVTTGTVTNLTSTSASIASANAGTAVITNLTATGASVASANVGTAVVTGLTVTNASIASLNAGTATITTGNLTFSSTGQRITGDFSNATQSNRLAFQTSTTNGVTNVGAIPNGTAASSGFRFYGGSDPNNATLGQIIQNGSSDTQIRSDITGTGTYAPLTFYTGGSERMRLDTSGQLGIGTTNPQGRLHVTGTTTNLASGYSALNVFSSDALAADKGGRISLGGVSGNGASFDPYGFVAIAGLKENATASNFAGYFTVSTSNSGGVVTERMRIDSSGNVGIGGTADANAKVMITGTYPVSSNSGRAMRIAGTIPSGTTDNFIGVASIQSTQAASFTLSNLFHFYAIQSTIGAGSAVTNQYGFFAQSSLTGATNNYGFYSDIASGSNRWNFYAAGTARNYMAGRLSVGTTTDDAFLHVLNGDNSVTGRIASNASTGLTTDIFQVTALNHASGTGFYFERFYSSGPTVQFGVRGDGTVYAQNTTIQSLSDARVKENVRTATEGLSVIDALRPVRFDFKEGFGNNRKNQLGFVAQEVEAVFPDAVDVMGDKDENGDLYKSVGPAALIPVLVKAIQELSARLAALEAK